MKKPNSFFLLYALLPLWCLCSTKAFSQLVENHVEYANSDDWLYPKDQRTTSIAAYPQSCFGIEDQIDFYTGHTALLEIGFGYDWTDEAFVLSALYKDPASCEILTYLEQIVVDMKTTVDDFDGLPIVLNNETIYDLRVDDKLNLIGCGTYTYVTDCNGSPQVFKPGVTWPFYFKYNTLNRRFEYFRRISKLTGNCKDNPVLADPVDIEILNDKEYIIGMNGREGGILVVNNATGDIVREQRYLYRRGVYFDPVDLEVTNDRIYAIGSYSLDANRNEPSILAVHHNLSSPVLRRYNIDNPRDYKAEMTAIRFNPETKSLMTIGHELTGIGGLFAIQIEDLYGLAPTWTKKYQGLLPDKIVNLGPTYGLEYLRNKKRFVFHSFGSETGPIDPGGDNFNLYHYLVEIENSDGEIVSINRLIDDYDAKSRNPLRINNTLVQSYRTNHLGLVLPRTKLSNDTIPIGLFTTERYYHQSFPENCMVSIDHFTEKSEPSVKVRVVTRPYDALDESYTPDQIWRNLPLVDQLCQSNAGGQRSEVEEELSEATFKAFPNPASDWLNFAVPKRGDSKAQIQIISAQGQLMDLIKVETGATHIQHQTDHYIPGIYIANLVIGNQWQESIRFVILP